ncbi:HlyD family efflux transporter periplasmic adaptor subunit [Ramlibacter sp. G-1-2-2]|uniref:HlyD family efflux transporter periplasmic adaptor subunit n=1 Tax=Ramlibacter agri TaxID=2728837 RepID=A0A848HEC4_9BURK|nr:HlyD family efflux transporter periplasmic adaptor subunit [Ramlibacter agri]NML47711.1 HlyD family efflux transporter periplasmic adaptor subunit [Ramlibacter agri]
MKKKTVAAIVVVLAVVALGALAWWWHARQRPAADELVLYGNVDIRQVSLAFEGSGRVAALRAEEGDAVKAGAVLAVLDTSTLALQAEQAQAQIEVQRQNLLRLRNGARPQELAQARSRVTEAQADAARAGRELARLQDIASTTQGRGVSPQDLDRARTSVQVAQARLQEQNEALRLTQLGPRSEEVSGAAAQLKASQAQLALLQHQIGQGELRAPVDAVVRSRLLEPGDMATPQRPVFALALTQPKWVRVFVSETELGKVRPGQAARVFTDSQPAQPLAGRVGFISSVAEFTPKSVQTEELRTSLVYEVRVLVEDGANALRLGQPATVRIALRAAQ